MASGLMAATAMIKVLESRGYGQDMAKIALESTSYAGVDDAALLLDECAPHTRDPSHRNSPPPDGFVRQCDCALSQMEWRAAGAPAAA